MRAFLAGLAALTVASACSGATLPSIATASVVPAPGGTAVEAVVGRATTLNPLFEQEDNSRDVDSLIYQGLTAVDAHQRVVGRLASSWEVSPDGLNYVFHLREGVRWADGRPFTADDVMFTFHVLQTPDYRQPTEQFWKEIRVEELDPMTVRFTLKAPSASFPLALRQGIVAKHVFQGVAVADMPADPASGAHAIGTGPFKVGSISSDGSRVVLDRNPYASPQPHLDHIEFHGYASLGDAVDAVSRGEADTVGALEPPQLSGLTKRPDLTVRQIPTFGFVAVLFNLEGPARQFFASAEVRQALAKAVDRKQIVEGVLGGRADPAPGPIPPSDWAYDPQAADQLAYDPRAAAAALDRAGWRLDPQSGLRMKGGVPFSVELVTEDGFPYKDVAGAVSRQLRQVGVDVKVVPVSASVLVGKYLVGKQFEMALAAFDNGPDPDQYSLWHSGAAADTLNFSNAELPHQALIDKDLEDGRASTDRSKRRDAYADFQRLMAAAAPAIFLYEPQYAYLVSRRLHGVRTNPVIEPVGRLEYAADWFVNTKGA